MTTDTNNKPRYELVNITKMGMLVGYKVVDNNDRMEDPIYTYGEHELDKGKSKVNFLNLLNEKTTQKQSKIVKINTLGITKTKLDQLNSKLTEYNLELIIDKYSKKLQCFCTTLKQDKEQLYNMDIINYEIQNAKTLTDITHLPYFK